MALESDRVIARDNKKDRIADARVRKADGGKLQLYYTLDSTNYCMHTAFAAALPQVINATRRLGGNNSARFRQVLRREGLQAVLLPMHQFRN